MRKSFTWLSRLLLPLALASSIAHAAPYPFPSGTPMPGVSPEAFANVCERADIITKIITDASPGASEQSKACLNVLIKFELLRVASFLESFQAGGRMRMVWHGTSAAGDKLVGGVDERFAPNKAARWYDMKAMNASAGPGGAQEGSSTKLIKYLDEHCDGNGGGNDGAGGSGVLVERYKELKGKNFMWERDPKFGPRILPEYEPGTIDEDDTSDEDASEAKSQSGVGPQFFKKLVATLREAKATRNYPGGALDEMIEHALAGRLTAQDVERLHVLAGFVGYQMAAPPAGFIRLTPSGQALPSGTVSTDKQVAPKR